MGLQRLLICASCVAILVAIGCAGAHGSDGWEGPQIAQPISERPWSESDSTFRIVSTPHYQIHTNIKDADSVRRLAQTMEGAFQQYQKLMPQMQISGEPLNCYVFAQRAQWEAFTRQHTGQDAAIYLQINRGGY